MKYMSSTLGLQTKDDRYYLVTHKIVLEHQPQFVANQKKQATPEVLAPKTKVEEESTSNRRRVHFEWSQYDLQRGREKTKDNHIKIKKIELTNRNRDNVAEGLEKDMDYCNCLQLHTPLSALCCRKIEKPPYPHNMTLVLWFS